MTNTERTQGHDEVDLSADEFRALFDAVSTWGRWGDRDERGALNHLTADRIVAAAGLIRSGDHGHAQSAARHTRRASTTPSPRTTT